MNSNREAAKETRTVTHDDHEITVESMEAEEVLRIDDRRMVIQRDASTGAYFSPALPYRTFGSLEELARAVIDEQLVDAATAQEDEDS